MELSDILSTFVAMPFPAELLLHSGADALRVKLMVVSSFSAR